MNDIPTSQPSPAFTVAQRCVQDQHGGPRWRRRSSLRIAAVAEGDAFQEMDAEALRREITERELEVSLLRERLSALEEPFAPLVTQAAANRSDRSDHP